MELHEIQQRYIRLGIGNLPKSAFSRAAESAGHTPGRTSEIGLRSTEESRLRAMYNQMYADPRLVQAIRDIREMDRRDPRVKKIHDRTARSLIKGGLQLDNPTDNKRLNRVWEQFVARLDLANPGKLASHARGFLMEGNLPVQWVLDQQRTQVVQAVRMPTDTIRAVVKENGQFENPLSAYEQWDHLTGEAVARFALWQMTMGRLSPDNWDDFGSMGRPYLDAAREKWQMLTMTEQDMVIRRRERAPQKLGHFLEGATKEELQEYEAHNQAKAGDIQANYYSNKKGTIQPIEGDANMDQIKDVVLLMDAFFSGAPAPKQLFGYADDLNRDILEDLKQEFFEELDVLQDTITWTYTQGFRLQLLLSGINPDSIEFDIQFAERMTETLNMRTDRALKLKAIGASQYTVHKTAGMDPHKERQRKKQDDRDWNPYPSENQIGVRPRVSVTEGNATKGESATDITND